MLFLNDFRGLGGLHPKHPANGSRGCSLLENCMQALADCSASEFLCFIFQKLIRPLSSYDALSLFCGKEEGFFFFLEGFTTEAANQMGWTGIEFNTCSS